MTKTKRKIATRDRTRNIRCGTKTLLYTKAGGRCEFFNCNRYLLQDRISKKYVNWGEMAHIIAFSDIGPRSGIRKKPVDLNNTDNLMLLCPSCHVKVDKKVNLKVYSADALRSMKTAHEGRILHASSFKPDKRTKVLILQAKVDEEIVTISTDEMVEALLAENTYTEEQDPLIIDFTDYSSEADKAYWTTKMREIKNALEAYYHEMGRAGIKHTSVFALGPMPLLIYLGSQLQNKVRTSLFQRHRGYENWCWLRKNSKLSFELKRIQRAKKNRVTLVLPISGPVDTALIPESIKKGYNIYELRPKGRANYNLLQSKGDIASFERAFSDALGDIKARHDNPKTINLIPAIPAPLAVTCGRALNRKADPKLMVFNTTKGMYKYALTVN